LVGVNAVFISGAHATGRVGNTLLHACVSLKKQLIKLCCSVSMGLVNKSYLGQKIG